MMKFDAIVFCGLDGSGKSTQAHKLTAYLDEQKIKHSYVWLRYPNRFSLPFAALLRIMNISGYPIPESKKKSGISDLSKHKTLGQLWKTILAFDFKLSNNRKVLKPIKKNELVIVDRYVTDTIVELAVSTGANSVSSIAEEFLKMIPQKSQIIFLDIDPAISYERNHEEGIETLTMKRKLYLELCAMLGNVLIIDGSKSIEDIHKIILAECIK